MKIPYGQSNFKKVISQGFYYVDKTAYIRTLEDEGEYTVLLRPRRFGKSLFLSMLFYYYDVNHATEFDSLFGHLAIGQDPTPTHNKFQILKLDFSGIRIDNPDTIHNAFNDSVGAGMESLLNRYHYPQSAIDHLWTLNTPEARAQYFLNEVEKAGQTIYLLIDEYDHFANALLADDLGHFKRIMGKGGFVRAFYEVLKTGTQQGTIDRIFITGVTPIMLDSLTSGFNITENISGRAGMNKAIGFTRQETENIVKPLATNCSLDFADMMQNLTRWYNGYTFSEDDPEPTLFNADMVLYFARHFNQQRCQYPKQMLDENIASDYGKILAMFSIGDRDVNYQVLDQLITEGEVIAKQQRKFDFDKGFDRDDFISLLYYMGFVALAGDELSHQRFRIPNYVIKVLYFQYFKIEIERKNNLAITLRDLEKSVVALALHNDFELFRHEIERVLQILSNRDFMQMDEKHIKVLLLALLHQSEVYFVKSESEINHKYPDIMLLERSPYAIKHEHLIELKYCKKSARKKDPKAWDDKLQEGIDQVKGYLQLPDIKPLSKLSAWVVLTDGEEVVVEMVNL